MFIAKIYVENLAYHIDQPFDYIVPIGMELTLQRGCRVLVPFGRANKKIQGLCVEIFEEELWVLNEREFQLKPIFSQIDATPEVDEETFALIEYLVKTTFCTYYDAIKTILPSGENVSVKVLYSLAKTLSLEELSALTKPEFNIYKAFEIETNADGKKNKKEKTDKELQKQLGVKNITRALNLLVSKEIVAKKECLKKSVSKKTKQLVTLNIDIETFEFDFTPKQQNVITIIRQLETATVKELSYQSGVTEGVVKNLIKKEILRQYTVEIDSIDEKLNTDKNNNKDKVNDTFVIDLSEKQTEVFNGILDLVKDENANTSLLFGITGSGKTQIYIKLIEEVLQMGKTAILLVPEISLTPQLLNKFESYFGENIAVIHSNLTIAERLLTYKRIKAGKVSIGIGARSAIFAPFKNLGIVILDEEGESSYKSDCTPRYHARDIARFRCRYGDNKASLLLGSATPSIESYNNAKTGKYHLFVLEERFANAQLPSVFIVDMLAEQKAKNFAPLSEVLVEQIHQNLQAGEQTMLLINRRGFNTFATCIECEEVLKCKKCDVSMTYHKANGFMMCHYCGISEDLSVTCQCCGSSNIKLTGVGTQKLENELELNFPNARILRMDSDTTGGKYSYEEYFNDFKEQKYDIMVGTQMIAKGLDFPNVTLVGVLNADSGLYSTDYKASERVFSLVTQVIGRSGRSEKSGRAYIQTMKIDNSTINYASNQDYEAFFNDEIFARHTLQLPPYCSIVVISFSGINEMNVENSAYKTMEILRLKAITMEKIALKVLGVSKASVYKINNNYRYRMIIKCKLNNAMRELIKYTLCECGNDKSFYGVSVLVDVNGDI